MRSTIEHNSGKTLPMMTEHDLGNMLRLAADSLVGVQQARQRLDAVLTYWSTYDMDEAYTELVEIRERLNTIFDLQKP